MINKLDNTLPAFGIARGCFDFPFSAYVRASSSYLNKPLYDLMKYQKKGEYYLFEDEYVRIYDPTEPTKNQVFLLILNLFILQKMRTL